MELEDLGDYSDSIRVDIKRKCLEYGLMNLASIVEETNDMEEVVCAAELDAIDAGCDPGPASRAVQAGMMAIHVSRFLQWVGNAALTPEIEEGQ
jgi:hypothetical protein